jgi:transcriptional regulator with XRE-family HTH domain
MLRQLLIERRQRAKLTQEGLAERLGRQQNFVSRIERGIHRVTVVELVEIAEALDFDPMAVVRRIKATHDDE